MGLFTSSRKKKSSTNVNEAPSPPAAASTAPEATVEVTTATGVVAMPALDLDKAAAVIEARQRGKMARRKTEGLKAYRASPDEGGPLADFMAKCMPCLQQKSE